MADYFIGPERENLHGHLSNKIPPALRIRSGDTVTFSTLEGDWRLERPAKPESSSGLFFRESFRKTVVMLFVDQFTLREPDQG